MVDPTYPPPPGATAADVVRSRRPGAADFTTTKVRFHPAAIEAAAVMTVQPSRARMQQLSDLIYSLDNAGLWTDIALFGLHAMHDAQAALVDLKDPTRIATANGGPVFTADRGYAGDGVDAELNWGVALGGLTGIVQDNHCCLVWSLTDAQSDTGFDLGVVGSDNVYISGRKTTGGALEAKAASTTATSIAVADSQGLYGYSRSGASAGIIVKNGASPANVVSTSAALPAGNLTTLRSNAAFGARQIAATIVMKHKAVADQAALYRWLREYLIAVGAVVV